jgi:hypothetical protein
MDLGFLVALDTLLWRAGKDFILMAIFAGDFGMFSLQWENALVCKVVHAVHPIVAAGAVEAVLFLVTSHKSRPLFALGVTVDAALHSHVSGFTLVAVIAGERDACVRLGMANQAESRPEHVVERYFFI